MFTCYTLATKLSKNLLRRPSLLSKIQNIAHSKWTESNTVWILQFDGGSRGNPGISGCGAVIYATNIESNQQKEIWNGHKFLGTTTNNVAEYQALILGLKQGIKMGLPNLTVQGDSQLVIKQIKGEYRTTKSHLLQLKSQAKDLLQRIPQYTLVHIPRALNSRADKLSNVAMDRKDDVCVDVLMSDHTSTDVISKTSAKQAINGSCGEESIDEHSIIQSNGSGTIQAAANDNSIKQTAVVQVPDDDSYDWLLYFDGGSRGSNRGGTGAGSVLYSRSSAAVGFEEVWHRCHFIGASDATSNVAEYRGLIEGLKEAVRLGLRRVKVRGDSQLVIRQLQGRYAVRKEHLKPLYAEAAALLALIPECALFYVPRALNARADELSNMAMDLGRSHSWSAPSTVAT